VTQKPDPHRFSFIFTITLAFSQIPPYSLHLHFLAKELELSVTSSSLPKCGYVHLIGVPRGFLLVKYFSGHHATTQNVDTLPAGLIGLQERTIVLRHEGDAKEEGLT
jgi:hypothetical protein